MTNLEAKQALARKLNIDYSNLSYNDLFNETDLQSFIQVGVQKGWDYKEWDFTEGAKTGTLSSLNISSGYVDYPSDMVTGGASHLVVNGKEFPPEYKLQYRDYLKWKQENPSSTDKYWAEYKRFIFMNMLACTAGQTFDVYGKLRCPTLSADADLMPFSTEIDNQEDSGNIALVDLAYAEALESDKKQDVNKAALVRKNAYGVLDILWKPMEAYKANQQPKARPFFIVPNYFGKSTTTSQSF